MSTKERHMNVIKHARTTVPNGLLSVVAVIGLALLMALSWWELR
jgi:hypothetical protein